jgi:hypothetical protein
MSSFERFVAAVVLWSVAAVGAAQTQVFSDDFNAAPPAAVSGGQIESVQGYQGLGHAGNQFGGSFLRSATGDTVTLTLSNLPQHNSISLGFLFAAIDSLDGTGVSLPLGDFFRVTLDGQTIFRESFANAEVSQVQSYQPAGINPGIELARRVNLGFSGPDSFYTDSAYDLSLDPSFQRLAHSAGTAVFGFQIEGPGIQPLADESWAMDNLRVSVSAVPEPRADLLMLAGLVGCVVARRKRWARGEADCAGA